MFAKFYGKVIFNIKKSIIKTRFLGKEVNAEIILTHIIGDDGISYTEINKTTDNTNNNSKIDTSQVIEIILSYTKDSEEINPYIDFDKTTPLVGTESAFEKFKILFPNVKKIYSVSYPDPVLYPDSALTKKMDNPPEFCDFITNLGYSAGYILDKDLVSKDPQIKSEGIIYYHKNYGKKGGSKAASRSRRSRAARIARKSLRRKRRRRSGKASGNR